MASIKKYIEKYKIARPYLKRYLKNVGYCSGLIHIIKTMILGGLKSIYHQLVPRTAQVPQAAQVPIVSPPEERTNTYQYVIVAPDFVSNSAGIYCLYKLCHDLRQKGFHAVIYGSLCTPQTLDAPLLSERQMIQIREDEHVWGVYPETISGNPYQFKNVARWVLNRPGLLGGDKIYHSDEKIFIYSNVYRPYVSNFVHGKLHMPTFDRSIFYPPKPDQICLERNLACYYVGKSTFKAGYFDVSETFEITRTSPMKHELGKLFRSAKVLYSFDNSTALTYEAIACGCPVQIIPDGTQVWEDYEKLEWGTAGIFWNKPFSKLTDQQVKTLLDNIQFTEEQYHRELDHFIHETVGDRF